ncbi:MAG: mRNA-capping enzyme subunit beta [Trizodia sp. TS-e1964]|nr:MAG: mRNA-capping enzyme subunit beta [Trizodia sp. TS-e1964]
MDLRSMLNNDASSNSMPSGRPQAQSQAQLHGQTQYSPGPKAPPLGDGRGAAHTPQAYAAAPTYPAQGQYHTRPVPPPLMPPSQADFRSPGLSSQHTSAHSPYAHTPSSSGSGGQYPFPKHPPPPSPGSQGQYQSAFPRDSFSASPISHNPPHLGYGQPSPISYNASAAAHNAAQSLLPKHQSPSLQSTPTQTPTSAQSQTAFHRGSPTLTGAPSYPRPQLHQRQQSHNSQPATPLGPPVSFSRPAIPPHREGQPAYSNDLQGSQPGSSYPAQAHFAAGPPHPPAPLIPNIAGTVSKFHEPSTPAGHGSRSEREYVSERERERSISVSPKTLPSKSYKENVGEQATPIKRKKSEDPIIQSQSSDMTHVAPRRDGNSLLGELDQKKTAIPSFPQSLTNGGPSLVHTHDAPQSSELATKESKQNSPFVPSNELKPKDSNVLSSSVELIPQVADPHITSEPPKPKASTPPSQHPPAQPSPTSRAPERRDSMSEKSHSKPATAVPHPPPSTRQSPTPAEPPASTGLKRDAQHASLTNPLAASSQNPPKKRARYDEPPIFARKAGRSAPNSPVVPVKKEATATAGSIAKQEAASSANGHPADTSKNGVSLPLAQPDFAGNGPLGQWEPSILNTVPYEEVTRVISDFLFVQVVRREDVAVSSINEPGRPGAQLEIEAKIGQLIDKYTNVRLKLPVLNECVVSQNDSSLKVNFKSSMTEAQHKTLNQYLNKAVTGSMNSRSSPQTAAGEGPARPRIPMTYVHTRERDSFYELPSSEFITLPPSIRARLGAHPKIKVRVTTDQRTGKTLAKIIKARVADLDVYSPRTAFDWRVSINLEMTYTGSIEGLLQVGEKSDRNKDRMSYRHLAYQIDLTQVTGTDANAKSNKEHELEVELSADHVRKQGLLALNKLPTQYEELVKGFVDNVRILARVVDINEGR